MKLMKARMMCVMSVLVAVAIVLIAGCGGKAGVGAPGKSAVLKYDMDKKEALKYRSVSESIQNMKVQAMEMQVRSGKKLVFSVRPEGYEGKNYKLAITVDSLEVSVDSPQGNVSADASSMLGKSFSMILSPMGEELDISGAELLEYDMGMAGKRNVVPDFQTVFPNVADSPIEIGGTWTTFDTLRVNEGGGELVIVLEAVNTLEGFETMKGLECARVSAVVTGTVKGEGEQGGAKMNFDGTFSGNDLWHFAYKKGTLVSSVSKANVENTITVSGPQEMVIPMTQTTTIDIVLVD